MDNSDWFKIQEIEDGIFSIEEPQHVRCFLIRGKTCAALIDTGMGFLNIERAIKPLVETPVTVFNTHWHFDHIGGNAGFRNIGIAGIEERLITERIPNATLMPLYIIPCVEKGIPFPGKFVPEKYEINSPPATFTFDDGDIFDLGGRIIRAISTPGHTHGSFSFLDSQTRSLFCGDLIYKGTLYAHFMDSDIDEYIDTLEQLEADKDEFANLYPGHGDKLVAPESLSAALSAFQSVKRDSPNSRPAPEWIESVLRYDFEDFSILTKAAGFPGIDLLKS
ncbi:MAG TPA: MBL fold metallo-hydrolase [Syntrophorhabdaceae bacterium]|nr:MBL fold metallo-hydrolase [Syntrophorhabdaceae bacterium]